MSTNIGRFQPLRFQPRPDSFLDSIKGTRGEVYWDKNSNTLRLYDGVATGGANLALESYVDNAIASLSNLSLSSLTLTGDLTSQGLTTLQETAEVLNTKSDATGVVTHDFSTGTIWYHVAISSNFTANFTNVPTTNNRAMGCTLVLGQGGTARIPNAVQIDGVAQTIKWSGGTVPTGNANKIDVVSFTLLRVSSTWTVLGSLSTYG